MDSILDANKTLLLFVFIYDSEESWAYHQSGVLQNYFNEHGPNGDNSVMVLALPVADPGTIIGYDDSQGNWVENTPYPIAYPHQSVPYNADLALLQFSPLVDQGWQAINHVYRVCPDRRIYQLGLPSADSLTAAIQLCEIATESNDARLIAPVLDTHAVCPSESRPLRAHLSNMGTLPLTSCELVVSANGQAVQTFDWTGNLPTYGIDTIQFDNLIADGTATTYKVFPRNPNATTDQNTVHDTITQLLGHAEFWDSDSIEVEIQADGYGHQIYWDIKDAAGNEIAHGCNESVGANNGSNDSSNITEYEDFEYINESVSLAGHATECMTIRVLSGLGYGTCCNFGNGYMRFKKNGQTIFNFTNFGRRAYAKLTTTFVSSTEQPLLTTLKVYPNPTEGHINIAFGLQEAADVSIEVLNVMGQRVVLLPPSGYMSGSQAVLIDATQLPNGMYWAVLHTWQGSEAVKFVVAQ